MPDNYARAHFFFAISPTLQLYYGRDRPRIRRTELYDRVTYTAAVTPVVLVLTVLESAELGVKPRNSYFCAEKSGSTEHGTGYLRVSAGCSLYYMALCRRSTGNHPNV